MIARQELFKKSYAKRQHVFDFICTLNPEILPASNSLRDHENYAQLQPGLDKYFLSEMSWSKVYKKIVNLDMEEKKESFNLEKQQYSVTLTELRNKLSFHIESFLDTAIKIKPTKGCPAAMDKRVKAFLEIITKENVDYYVDVIFFRLQDHITSSLIKNSMEEDFELDLTETSFAKSFATTILNTFFYQFTDYVEMLQMKTSEHAQKIEEFFSLIFQMYDNSPEGLTTEQLSLLRNELSSAFSVKIHDPFLVDYVCMKTLLLLLKRVVDYPDDIRYMGIAALFNSTFELEERFSVIESFLESRLIEEYIMFGSIITTKLREANIIDIYTDVQYVKRGKKITKKTPRKIKLLEDIIYILYMNSGGFKPFLHKSNIKDKLDDFNLHTGDTTVTFQLNHIKDKIHLNYTGRGKFNPDSVLYKDYDTTQIYVSVDSFALDGYMSLLEETSNPSPSNTKMTQSLEEYKALLSIYQINFDQIRESVKDNDKLLLDDIIKFGANIREEFNFVESKDLQTRINDIENNIIKDQVKQIFETIRSYKFVLSVSLSDYILYSLFNHCILPSYYDFRGRRYIVGLTFNIQSYPFLKAFVKIFEPDVRNLDKNIFYKIRDAIIKNIKYDDLKETINKKMRDITHSEELLTKSILDFFYAHINTSMMTTKQFDEIFYSNDETFSSIYQKIFPVTKKKSRALPITSFIHLEHVRRKHKINYVNSYSYDMVLSGYEMIALLFPSREFGVMANLIGNESVDLYTEITTYFNKRVNKVLKLLRDFKENFSQKENTSINEDLLQESNEILEEFLSSFCIIDIEYDIILPEINNNIIIVNILTKLQDVILKEDWILMPRDFNYMEKNIESNNSINKCLLILGRISMLNDIKEANPWIDQKHTFSNRALFKHLVMILLYGGTRNGRYKQYEKFMTEFCMEFGTRFNSKEDRDNLFNFIENFYQLYSKTRLYGVNHVMSIGKYLAKKNKMILIKNPYFICQLSPVKLIKYKRPEINPRRIGRNHYENYQLTIKKPPFNAFNTLRQANFILDKRKLKNRFPPNYIHSMDGMMPHSALTLFHKVNKLLELFNYRISFVSVHDNGSLGRLLYNILPEVLINAQREIYEFNYLNALKDNFQEKEFSRFMEGFTIKNRFSVDEISNYNMMKPG